MSVVLATSMAVMIVSETLGEKVWIATDREAARHIYVVQGVREAIYLAEDIKAMIDMPKEALQHIHAIKKAFPGSVVEFIGPPPEPTQRAPPDHQQLGLALA